MFTWLKNILGMGEASGVRARNAKGRYIADDKSTPDVNEAMLMVRNQNVKESCR